MRSGSIRESLVVTSRRLGTIGVLLALTTGCSGAGADTPAGSATREAASVVAEQDAAEPGASLPVTTAEPTSTQAAAPSSTSDATSPATSSDAEVETEADPSAEQPSVPEEAQPTFQEQPEAALSDEEIRETYADNPPPADSVQGTLCNLTQAHLAQLSAATTTHDSIDDQMLRLAALSLSDDLSVWEGMAWQYPELASDIEAARTVYAHWEFAIGLHDTGDPAAAVAELKAADELIDTLPDAEALEVGC